VTKVRIGTRGSALALAQANWVKARLLEKEPALSIEIRTIKTSGDRLPDLPLANLGGKGVFTKEIEEALLREEIDLAVHSMKDLPPHLPAGLVIAATPAREDPRDVLVARTSGGFHALEPGTKIGTGSLRRQAQLLHARPDLVVVPIRGNVDTRLRKLDQGEVDALVLAAAGLKRLGREQRIVEHLGDGICVSAAAQGCLGIETREESATRAHLAYLHDPDAWVEVAAE
jgi:hydroxymethylbilane synthase